MGYKRQCLSLTRIGQTSFLVLCLWSSQVLCSFLFHQHLLEYDFQVASRPVFCLLFQQRLPEQTTKTETFEAIFFSANNACPPNRSTKFHWKGGAPLPNGRPCFDLLEGLCRSRSRIGVRQHFCALFFWLRSWSTLVLGQWKLQWWMLCRVYLDTKRRVKDFVLVEYSVFCSSSASKVCYFGTLCFNISKNVLPKNLSNNAFWVEPQGLCQLSLELGVSEHSLWTVEDNNIYKRSIRAIFENCWATSAPLTFAVISWLTCSCGRKCKAISVSSLKLSGISEKLSDFFELHCPPTACPAAHWLTLLNFWKLPQVFLMLVPTCLCLDRTHLIWWWQLVP